MFELLFKYPASIFHKGQFVFLTPWPIWLMAIAMRQLEMGVTYAVWAASGTAAIALVGIAFYGEQTSALKLAGLALVVSGVVLLNLEAQP